MGLWGAEALASRRVKSLRDVHRSGVSVDSRAARGAVGRGRTPGGWGDQPSAVASPQPLSGDRFGPPHSVKRRGAPRAKPPIATCGCRPPSRGLLGPGARSLRPRGTEGRPEDAGSSWPPPFSTAVSRRPRGSFCFWCEFQGGPVSCVLWTPGLWSSVPPLSRRVTLVLSLTVQSPFCMGSPAPRERSEPRLRRPLWLRVPHRSDSGVVSWL